MTDLFIVLLIGGFLFFKEMLRGEVLLVTVLLVIIYDLDKPDGLLLDSSKLPLSLDRVLDALSSSLSAARPPYLLLIISSLIVHMVDLFPLLVFLVYPLIID